MLIFGNVVTVCMAAVPTCATILAVKGTDPQEAEGNEDGRIRDNSVYRNEIWSDQDLVWKATEAEDNVFWVRSFLFMGFRKK